MAPVANIMRTVKMPAGSIPQDARCGALVATVEGRFTLSGDCRDGPCGSVKVSCYLLRQRRSGPTWSWVGRSWESG